LGSVFLFRSRVNLWATRGWLDAKTFDMLASEILDSPIIVGTQLADYTNKVLMIKVSDTALKGAAFAT